MRRRYCDRNLSSFFGHQLLAQEFEKTSINSCYSYFHCSEGEGIVSGNGKEVVAKAAKRRQWQKRRQQRGGIDNCSGSKE